MKTDRTGGEVHALFEEGYAKILQGLKKLGYDVADENFRDTAGRAARGFAELVKNVGEVEKQTDELLTKVFPARYQEMVVSKHNVAFGVCPHHLLPVIYRVSVAYIPKDKVLGISKLTRLVQLHSRRPVLQEDYTHTLAQVLFERLESAGAAAYVEGLHMCLASRGVMAHEARVVTSAVRGVFLEQATRTEFLDLVTHAHPSLL